LTGDKQETAETVGVSTNLINEKTKRIYLTNPGNVENNLLDYVSEYNLEEKEKRHSSNEVEISPTCLILSGKCLLEISKNKLLTRLLGKLALVCEAVICCRVSPKQKAEIVKLLKDSLPYSKTLSIGDGANDVNMIAEAHVGIGIKGLEGQQAARVSDFAISEFQHLKRLIIYYGRESYRKNSLLVLFTFWKNILLVFPQFWISLLHNNFSGIPVYEKIMMQMFNILYASLPIIIFAVFDHELSEHEFLSNPAYYRPGLKKVYFNLQIFVFWLIKALIHSLSIAFFCSLLAYQMDSKGHYFSFSTLGTVIYLFLCIFVNVNIYVISNSFSWLNQIILLLSVLSLFVTCALISLKKQTIAYHVFSIIFSNMHTYFVFIALFCLIFIFDYLFEICRKIFLFDSIGLEMIKFTPKQKKVDKKEMEYIRFKSKVRSFNDDIQENIDNLSPSHTINKGKQPLNYSKNGKFNDLNEFILDEMKNR
jgi:phospholipid-transporting ATPase